MEKAQVGPLCHCETLRRFVSSSTEPPSKLCCRARIISLVQLSYSLASLLPLLPSTLTLALRLLVHGAGLLVAVMLLACSIMSVEEQHN